MPILYQRCANKFWEAQLSAAVCDIAAVVDVAMLSGAFASGVGKPLHSVGGVTL
jgi:hypothetical protein